MSKQYTGAHKLKTGRCAGADKRKQKGTVAVLVALFLVGFMAFTALAIDIGRYMVTRNELQNIADGAALASTRVLGDIYKRLQPADQRNYVCGGGDIANIQNAATSVGGLSHAGGLDNISIPATDILIGTWDGNTFTPTLNQPDAIRVIARRDGTANSPITSFFAHMIGINSLDVQMDAVAALSGQSTSEPGELELPIGISHYFFLDPNDDRCNDFIVFHPSNDPNSCAGWNSFEESPPNDSKLRQILDGDITSQETVANVTEFNFIGGNLSNPTFNALLMLFKNKGYDVTNIDGDPVATNGSGEPVTGTHPNGIPIAEDGLPLLNEDSAHRLDSHGNPMAQALYPDGTGRNLHQWQTSVVVYDWTSCANPNTAIKIVGYAKITMTDVNTAPDKKIQGHIDCHLYSNFDTRSGGGNFGVKGTIPGLVE